MQEEWKPVVGYEGLYEVSNMGNVRAIKNKIIVLKPHKHNYLIVKLYKKNVGKNYNIHQLVAMSFLNHTPSGFKIVIDHINEDRFDNRLSNLQLLSTRENLSKSKKNKTSNYTGVRFKKGKYESQITINNKSIYLGRFDDEYEAHLCYMNKLKSIQ
jgi:hypothetical protein